MGLPTDTQDAKQMQFANAQKRLTNIMIIRGSAGLAGNIAGLVYAFKTKKKFWGYVGFAILGGIVIGGIAALATMPAAGKAAQDMVRSSQATGKNKE